MGNLRFIDVQVSELEIPNDPEIIPERGVDRGVIPWAMVEYLKLATRFPVAPTISWAKPLLRVIGGGRCLWAAQQIRWHRPIRAILTDDRTDMPAAFWNRTQPFRPQPDDDEVSSANPQVLCFSRLLTETEKKTTEQEIFRLADQSRKKHLLAFSEATNLVWPSGNVLCWRTPVAANSDDRTGAVEFFEMTTRLRQAGIPLAACNGRFCY